MESCNITIVGCGYVGLVTGTCFASQGHTVHCLDIDQKKIEDLNNGVIPIHEPDLSLLIDENKGRRLFFTSEYEVGLRNAEFVFIAVDTPSNPDGSANMERVDRVVENLAPYLSPHLIIVLKSTVPIGTADIFELSLRKKGFQNPVVTNPEFLREGSAIYDCLNPERVVIGAKDPDALEKVASLYRSFVKNESPIILMDNKSAELSKYACNGLLATKISYMNVIARLCEAWDINVSHVERVMRMDGRIGSFIHPGIGFGGSCFPKDLSALIHIAKAGHAPFALLDSVQEVNCIQHSWLLEKIEAHFKGKVEGLRVALWGLSFKPNTDDIREAPALYFLKAGLERKLHFQIYDPQAMPKVKQFFREAENIFYAKDPFSALEGVDCLVICTEWSEFQKADPLRMKERMKNWVIFDGRNFLNRSLFQKEGFTCFGVGMSPACV